MRALLKLAVVACSVVLGILIVEYGLLRGALGYHGIVDAEIFAHDDQLGWKLQPNVDASVSTLDFAVTVRTDAMALRASDRSDAWRYGPCPGWHLRRERAARLFRHIGIAYHVAELSQ